jgi:hypothetical protein
VAADNRVKTILASADPILARPPLEDCIRSDTPAVRVLLASPRDARFNLLIYTPAVLGDSSMTRFLLRRGILETSGGP